MNSCKEAFGFISHENLVQATVINCDKGSHSVETQAGLTPKPLFCSQFKQTWRLTHWIWHLRGISSIERVKQVNKENGGLFFFHKEVNWTSRL